MSTVTAHRGDSSRAPENTLAAIRLAIEAGADRIEVDVRLTRDGEPVVIHDADLRRTAGADRRVGGLDLAALRRHDVGAWFGGEFAGERVPTLAEVLDLTRGRTKLNLELKASDRREELVAVVIASVRAAGREEEVLLSSFDEAILDAAAPAWPVARTAWIVGEMPPDLFAREVAVHVLAADLVTRTLVQDAHALHREIHVFTVNDPGEMERFASMGVDSIITDRPAVLFESERPAGGDRPGA